jgi:hypothetical protein
MTIFFLIVVLISFFGILFLLAAKFFEIRTGQVSAFGRLSVSVDPKLRRFVEKVKSFLSMLTFANLKSAITLGSHNLFHIFGTTGLFVSKHYKRITNRVNGQRTIKSGGVVSFFLKHVAESKEDKGDNS